MFQTRRTCSRQGAYDPAIHLVGVKGRGNGGHNLSGGAGLPLGLLMFGRPRDEDTARCLASRVRSRQPPTGKRSQLSKSAVTTTLLMLACLVLGLLAGGMLVIGVVFVSFWKSLSPSDFQVWF